MGDLGEEFLHTWRIVAHYIKGEKRMIETNIGEMPIADYREIKAMQCGFDNYDELYRAGYRIGHGLDADPTTGKGE